jgi:acyl-CoA synthetase (AMP-forming)/AMP-acid ligase II
VLKDEADQDSNKLKEEIVASCRARLDRHKVPAMIGFVSALPISSAGKLLRRDA